MNLPRLAELNAAAAVVARVMPPTPQYTWPLLNQRVGAEVWVKHENHSPVGAFKIRGGLIYMDWLMQAQPKVPGVIAATRGNHGQAVAFGARKYGIDAVIVVPFGNSREKNRAMLAFGAELVEHGDDFQAALEYSACLARERGLHPFPSFHEFLVHGTGTYAMEMFRGTPELDTVYVPIGLGSSICGVISARNALGLKTKIVGVVSADAPAYALSFREKKPVSHVVTTKLADGLACRTPVPDAVEIILQGADRIVEVSEVEIAAAMLALYQDTHNVAEGAGAAALAALLQERDSMRGKRVATVLTGGNVDREVFASVLAAHGTNNSGS